jgi:hypothetical protein
VKTEENHGRIVTSSSKVYEVLGHLTCLLRFYQSSKLYLKNNSLVTDDFTYAIKYKSTLRMGTLRFPLHLPVFVHCLHTSQPIIRTNYLVQSDAVYGTDTPECHQRGELFWVRKLLRNDDVKFIRVTFQNSVPTSQNMHYISITKTNLFTTCREITAAYSENPIKLKRRVLSRSSRHLLSSATNSSGSRVSQQYSAA